MGVITIARKGQQKLPGDHDSGDDQDDDQGKLIASKFDKNLCQNSMHTKLLYNVKLKMLLTVKSCDGGEEAKDDHYHHTGHQVDKDLQF